MQWGALYLSYEYVSFYKSIKKASIFNKNYKDKNEQHFHILKVLFLCGFCGDCILTRGLTESVLFAPKPRNSKVLALLTVNSPVDCLRIELIIKPLPKKAPNFRCFFPLFMLYYAVFTCFSHIDKITAHGLFRTLLFHFHIVFCSLCATQSTQSVWYIIKKASITSQIR